MSQEVKEKPAFEIVPKVSDEAGNEVALEDVPEEQRKEIEAHVAELQKQAAMRADPKRPDLDQCVLVMNTGQALTLDGAEAGAMVDQKMGGSRDATIKYETEYGVVNVPTRSVLFWQRSNKEQLQRIKDDNARKAAEAEADAKRRADILNAGESMVARP